ncbi:hypothetical protein DAETH_41660 (plasmid) [Deinococcus aetherius]|uniref:Uncharacterized protein n=1 Tax=Deinococcus aetherius TaxID=200252 RepID=A0ABM8AK43_9DEIO|nr:hypothetical protein [Deinococcus aetherius]BDP44197.1 hypothetical protein DAETH_41660 [Deinococcus aetherius]
MNTTRSWLSRSSFIVTAAALLIGAGQATVKVGPDNTLGSQLATMSGTSLTRAECQGRMRDLDALLQNAGYQTIRTRVTEDGTLIARWYNTEAKTTVLAFSGQLDVGNSFSAREYPGTIRWNEFTGTR